MSSHTLTEVRYHTLSHTQEFTVKERPVSIKICVFSDQKVTLVILPKAKTMKLDANEQFHKLIRDR